MIDFHFIYRLKRKGIVFEKGLTNKEVFEIEKQFNIKFPDELKSFLKIALPVSRRFPNWRKSLDDKEEQAEIQYYLDWPLVGLLHSVKNGYYWCKKWGEKPLDYMEQEKVVVREFKEYPKMIPIYSHRYIPSIETKKSPIFSIHQADVIYYGKSLKDYFMREFIEKENYVFSDLKEYEEIEFWSQIIGH